MSIEIYTKTFCPYCWRAKALLEAKGVEYREIPVDYGGEIREQMIVRANLPPTCAPGGYETG